jgi:hypothetical protein
VHHIEESFTNLKGIHKSIMGPVGNASLYVRSMLRLVLLPGGHVKHGWARAGMEPLTAAKSREKNRKRRKEEVKKCKEK